VDAETQSPEVYPPPPESDEPTSEPPLDFSVTPPRPPRPTLPIRFEVGDLLLVILTGALEGVLLGYFLEPYAMDVELLPLAAYGCGMLVAFAAGWITHRLATEWNLRDAKRKCYLFFWMNVGIVFIPYCFLGVPILLLAIYCNSPKNKGVEWE
jgi:hypothetical protein